MSGRKLDMYWGENGYVGERTGHVWQSTGRVSERITHVLGKDLTCLGENWTCLGDNWTCMGDNWTCLEAQLYGHSRQGGYGVCQGFSMGSETPTTPKWFN